MPDGSTSQTCHKPGQYHSWNMDHSNYNIVGGSNKNKYKNTFPDHRAPCYCWVLGEGKDDYLSNSINKLSTPSLLYPCLDPIPINLYDDDETVVTSNYTCHAPFESNHVMLDLGATGHFIPVSENLYNKWTTTKPKKVVIPDGTVTRSQMSAISIGLCYHQKLAIVMLFLH